MLFGKRDCDEVDISGLFRIVASTSIDDPGEMEIFS